MTSLPFGNTKDDDLPDLPEPNVEFITSDMKPEDFTEAGIKGMLMNPAYGDRRS